MYKQSLTLDKNENTNEYISMNDIQLLWDIFGESSSIKPLGLIFTLYKYERYLIDMRFFGKKNSKTKILWNLLREKFKYKTMKTLIQSEKYHTLNKNVH